MAPFLISFPVSFFRPKFRPIRFIAAGPRVMTKLGRLFKTIYQAWPWKRKANLLYLESEAGVTQSGGVSRDSGEDF